MQLILLWNIVLCCCATAVYGERLQDANRAKEYLNSGLFYKGLFNSAVNTQMNSYNATLYFIQHKEKIDMLTGIKGRYPTQAVPYIRYYRGLCYYYQGKFPEAIADFNSVPNSSDKYLEARIRLGGCYYKQKRTKEAKGLWDNLYSQHRNNPIFVSKLGNLYAELGINTQAVLKYCQKTDIGKRGLVWLYLRQNRINDALNLTKTIDAKTPDSILKNILSFYDPGLLRLKSHVYLSLAVNHYQRAIETEQSEKLNCQMGIAQLMSGRLNESIITLTPLINSNKWQIKAKAMINLGTAYYLSGSKTEAYNLWGKITNDYKENPVVMSELGYTYSRLGIRLNEALSLCREGSGLLSYYLGMVYFKKGVIEDNINYICDAPGLLQKGCRFPASYNPKVHNRLFLLDLSNVYYYKGMFGHSVHILMQLLTFYPDVEEIVYLTQSMNEKWKIIQFLPEFEIEWIDIWYQPS